MSMNIEVGVKEAVFKRGLETMRSHASKFGGDLKGIFAGALGGFGAAFSVKGILEFAGKMREVQKGAAMLGSNVESYQRVAAVAKASSSDIDLLRRALGKIDTEAAKAASGNKAAAAMFKKLGIDAREFVSLPLDKKIVALSEAWKESRGSAGGTAAMMELIGEKGRELIPILAQGPDALSKGLAAAVVQSKETVDAFSILGKSIDKLKASGAKAFASWAPMLDGIVADAAQDFGNIGKFLANPSWKTFKATLSVNAEKAEKDARSPDPTDQAQKEGDDSSNEDTPKMDALRKEIAEEEEKNRADALTGEAKLNELASQRAALESKINDNTLEGLEAKKQSLELDREINTLQKQREEQYKAAEDKMIQAREKAYLEKASPKEKLQYLQQKQQRLRAEADEMEDGSGAGGDHNPAAEKRTRAAGLRNQAAELETDAQNAEAGGGSDTAEEKRDGEAKLRTQAAELDTAATNADAGDGGGDKRTGVAGLRGHAAELEADAENADAGGMSGTAEEKRREAASLRDQADEKEKKYDPVKALEKRTQAEELQSQIDDLQSGKDSSGKRSKGPLTVSVDSLQRVGGGGGIGPATDTAVRQRDKTNALLQKLVDAQTQKATVTVRPARDTY